MNVEDIRQYISPILNSNMFLIRNGAEALVIDPHISEEALAYLRERGVRKVLILLTHEHYDHTSGIMWLTGCFESTLICQSAAAKSLRSGRNSRPIVMASQWVNHLDDALMRFYIHSLPNGYTYEADIVFESEKTVSWQGHTVHFVHTPGHSPGSCCIELNGEVIATGDSLIRHTPVITRFPGGSEKDFLEQAVPYLEGIRKGTWILPGHGETFRFCSEDLEDCLRKIRRP